MRTTLLRPPDFYGPDSQLSSIRAIFDAALKGGTANVVGPIDTPHEFIFVPDLAETLIALSKKDEAAIDLTHLQFMLLALVAWCGRSGEAVKQIELARSGGIQPMQVSPTIRVLETEKLLCRTRSKSDTRAKQVGITRKGLVTLRNAMPIAIEVLDSLQTRN